MMECEVQVGMKVLLQRDRPRYGQVSLLEIGVRIEIELVSMRHRVQVEISGRVPC